MTVKMKISLLTIIISAAAIIFTSCGEGTTDRLSSAEIEAYEDYVMSSYFMLRGDSTLPESRASWDYTQEVSLPTTATPVTATSTNYPEKGQSTTVTIEMTATTDVYKVTNVTTYPNRDSITSTTESYYIIDSNDDGYLVKDNGDGTYTTDPICTGDGTTDPLARIKFKTLYDDGTSREETIEAVGGDTGTVHYAEFNIDDPLVFPVFDDTSTWGGGNMASDDEWTPGTTTDTSVWSSMVSYNQSLEYDLLLWSYSKQIIGVRYYTEDGGVRTSVTYERTIATTTENEDLGDLPSWINKLFNGKNNTATDTAEGTVYTETVIRTKIEGDKKKEVKSDSVVYDEAGQTVVTFTANYETDENGVITSSGAPVAVY